ncbi:hypothetical protein BDQ12DRAFT_730183 [Crucibulum laeve]|uniref:Copper transporter n=1 Tax=Crucibulum laeve TaxID=68775 RepID=A0A5C3MGN3_9AGAR|nr:hypothetical protein BDQ12DRAFT_730183 [Crucibulum laeve]
MKLSLTSAILAGAGLAQVAAVPLRVIMVSSSQDVSPPTGMRFGHPVPHVAGMPATMKGQHRPCGSRFRQKAIEMSNAFRQALGLPLIETEHKHEMHGGMVKLMPFVGTPPTFISIHPNGSEGKTRGGDNIRIMPVSNLPHPHPHHGYHRRPVNSLEESSFGLRLQNALLELGTWEGRAIAFVLGVGMGVLFRLVWVLCIIAFRAFRGEREQEHEYSPVTIITRYDAEELLVPPPNYTVDEKTPVNVEQTKPADQAN